MGCMAAPEPPGARGREVVLRDVWQHPSSPEPGGKARCHRACGFVQAHVLPFLELVRRGTWSVGYRQTRAAETFIAEDSGASLR
jgi:hypothetical protein